MKTLISSSDPIEEVIPEKEPVKPPDKPKKDNTVLILCVIVVLILAAIAIVVNLQKVKAK